MLGAVLVEAWAWVWVWVWVVLVGLEGEGSRIMAAVVVLVVEVSVGRVWDVADERERALSERRHGSLLNSERNGRCFFV